MYNSIKSLKYLEIYFLKYVQDLYIENYIEFLILIWLRDIRDHQQMEEYTQFMDLTMCTTVKMSALLKLMDRFNTTLIQNLVRFSVEIDKLILKLTSEFKILRIAKIASKQTNKTHLEDSHYLALRLNIKQQQ